MSTELRLATIRAAEAPLIVKYYNHLKDLRSDEWITIITLFSGSATSNCFNSIYSALNSTTYKKRRKMKKKIKYINEIRS